MLYGHCGRIALSARKALKINPHRTPTKIPAKRADCPCAKPTTISRDRVHPGQILSCPIGQYFAPRYREDNRQLPASRELLQIKRNTIRQLANQSKRRFELPNRPTRITVENVTWITRFGAYGGAAN